jgi:type IV pilus assembly protein PilM
MSNISELLDPPNVRDDSSRWGFVTRLENLKQLFPDVPYELFSKSNIAHFEIEIDNGLVDLTDNDMPGGIGVLKEVERVPQSAVRSDPGGRQTAMARRSQDIIYTEDVLIDPMTNEEISRTYDIITQEDINSSPELTDRDLGKMKINRLTGKEQFIDRDHWFRIKAKFVWKDAPETAASSTIGGNVEALI